MSRDYCKKFVETVLDGFKEAAKQPPYWVHICKFCGEDTKLTLNPKTNIVHCGHCGKRFKARMYQTNSKRK